MQAHVVSARAVRPLRTRILRPSWVDRLASYPEDEDPDTRHLAVQFGGTIVGVGTVYPETPPPAHHEAIPADAFEAGAAYRLRGMATSESVRGSGVGRAVLRGCSGQVREGGGTYLWCNARLIALPFYERMGLAAVGDEFDIPEIGPHFVMWCRVT